MSKFLIFFLPILLAIHPNGSLSHVKFSELKFYHKSVNIIGEELHRVTSLTNDLAVFNRALDNILIPRVSGSPGNVKVQNYIMEEMSKLGWSVETDDFSATVPIFGNIKFRNIIASHNANAQRFLDLACHFDSKYFRDFEFLGATDSAVPCAIMIHLANSLNPLLEKASNNMLSLRLIFFDGEEAFKTWSSTDSLYGSRHLASKWNKTPYPEGGGDATQLDRIDMLVLLDLIGAADPTFYSFYSETQGWYKVLTNAETKLSQAKLLRSYRKRYFLKMSTDSSVEDDHIPFYKKDVPILHLISVPFPSVWHTAGDNRDIIDMVTTSNIIKILAVFCAEYLNLSV